MKRVYGDPAWVAIADNVGSDGICLDFDPLPGGAVGQIIYFDHEDSYRRWLAPSFRVWLEMNVSDLETGRLVWNKKLQGYEYPEAEEAGTRT